MAEHWLSADEIAVHLGGNPDTINKSITWKSMPANQVFRLWKFLASEVDHRVKQGHAAQTCFPVPSRANHCQVENYQPK